MTAGVFRCQGQPFDLGFFGAVLDLQFVPFLAVDLDDDGDEFVLRELGIPLGPFGVGDELRVTEPLPQLLTEVGGVGGEQAEEGRDDLPGQGGSRGGVVDEDHHLGDRGVHLQRFGVGRDFS